MWVWFNLKWAWSKFCGRASAPVLIEPPFLTAPVPSWSIPSPHWTPYSGSDFLPYSTSRRVRDAWAGLIADQCSSIGQAPSNSHAWRKFFMLPRCILANPTRGGRTQWRVTQVLVKTQIRRWLAGEFMELWNDVLAEEKRHARKNVKKKTPLETLCKSNARRARQAMGDGCYRKAIQALSSGGIAQIIPEVLEQMLIKHPQFPPPLPPPLLPSHQTPLPLCLTSWTKMSSGL